ncbi:WD40 repeat domain-containing protein [Ktedonobacter racemifer]|uniref:WD-40 repeat protein n=1 Tax=Ktedonobacter racemifer DSM 44963 TaxID=485913 RepID=D6TTJ3_KTERA|nr:WD40 repeat domain-containing protein [Ktedonobacter racemifer]EFH83744.1 WD-40 repeat protein [Ktedonobacter racemifer DSM 44963]
MNEHNEPFSPQRVDESIEEMLTTGQPHLPGQRSEDVNVRLVQDLQRVYDPEFTRYQQVLQRVEERLVEQRGLIEKIGAAPRPPLRPLPAPQERALFQAQRIQRGNRKNIMDDKKTGLRRYERSLSLLVAVIILAVLVGGFFVAQSRFVQLGASGSNNPKVASSPTPKSSPTGNNAVTIPGDQMGFQSVAWSNDSQRIASTTDNGVKIWDAATGKTLQAIKLPGENEWAYGVSWSPDSQSLAIATNQALRIANSQSGTVVRSYTTSLASTATPGAMSSLVGGSHYSTLFPTSGGLGFRGAAWSPDGHSIAVNVSAGPSGYIQVVNAQTATLDYTLKWDGSYNGDGLAWSSDGQYLATNIFDAQGGDPAKSNFVWAWKLASKALVFKQAGGGNPGSLAFQPKTHNLAFNTYTMNAPVLIQVWNIETNKPVASHSGAYLATWSPDGQQLAYNGSTQLGKNSYESNVTIVAANSGKVVHVYKEGAVQIAQLFWSPNGKYMLAIEKKTIMSKGQVTPSTTPDTQPTTIPNIQTVARVFPVA